MKINVVTALTAAVLILIAGCFPKIDPRGLDQGTAIRDHNEVIYRQSEYFVGLADRSKYPDPTTRPYADPQVIERHRASMQEGRDLQEAWIRYATPNQ
jgi:hypothetical protein